MEPTIMKQLNFKKIFLNLLWPLLPFTAQAQENNTLYSILSKDSILVPSPSVQNQEEDIVTQMPNRHHKYDKRVHRYRRAWEALIPTHTKLQYAGGMGLLSWGIGWDYGKRGQWETDLLLGFIPRYSSKHFKMTMTLKQNYIPWSIWLGKDFSLEPLTTGIYFNTVFSDDFWTSEPERYPRGYYGFPPVSAPISFWDNASVSTCPKSTGSSLKVSPHSTKSAHAIYTLSVRSTTVI